MDELNWRIELSMSPEYLLILISNLNLGHVCLTGIQRTMVTHLSNLFLNLVGNHEESEGAS